MTVKQNVQFLKIVNRMNLKQLWKFLLVDLILGLSLIIVYLFNENLILVRDVGLFFIWFDISLLIFHLQFIFHELAHFSIGNTSNAIKWLLEIQGPYGMRLEKNSKSSGDLSLKELQAPFIGRFLIFNLFLMLIQVFGSLEFLFFVSTKWLIIPFVFFWINYFFDILVTLLIFYWNVFSPKRTWLAPKIRFIAGTDILGIAFYKSIQIPSDVQKHLENFDPQDYVEKIEKNLLDNKIKKLYSNEKFLVFR